MFFGLIRRNLVHFYDTLGTWNHRNKDAGQLLKVTEGIRKPRKLITIFNSLYSTNLKLITQDSYTSFELRTCSICHWRIQKGEGYELQWSTVDNNFSVLFWLYFIFGSDPFLNMKIVKTKLNEKMNIYTNILLQIVEAL